MALDKLFVTLGGVGAIACIVWFFWLWKHTGTRAALTSSGYQEALILVKGGYIPDVIVVERGRPVRLNFRREETADCSEMVIFGDFNKSAKLPAGETVPLELLPAQPGEYTFACQMGMYRGRLVVV